MSRTTAKVSYLRVFVDADPHGVPGDERSRLRRRGEICVSSRATAAMICLSAISVLTQFPQI